MVKKNHTQSLKAHRNSSVFTSWQRPLMKEPCGPQVERRSRGVGQLPGRLYPGHPPDGPPEQMAPLAEPSWQNEGQAKASNKGGSPSDSLVLNC